MNIQARIAALAVVALALSASARAADVAGKWKSEFDSQIGVQKYTYEFKVDGDKLTGKASSEVNGQKREAEIKEGKVNGDEVSFVEPLKFEDQEIRIEYKGKISGDEIKLKRVVGDFATEDVVLKRFKESDAKTESKPAPAKP